MKRLLLLAALAGSALSPLPAYAADDLMGIYQGYAGDTETALDQPHRSANELGGWISDFTTDALMFTPGDNLRKLERLRKSFSANGFNAYMEFLKSAGLADALKNNTLSLSSVVSNAPLLIGQGASAGRYAWAFEVPLVLSVGPKTSTSDGATRPLVLRLQVGRSAQGPEPHGVLIESWQEFKEAAPSADTNSPDAPAEQSGGQPADVP